MLYVTHTHTRLYNLYSTAFVLWGIPQKRLTLFTMNPSLKTTFFLSVSILFAVLLTTELFLPAQVFEVRVGFFCPNECVTLFTPTPTHTHTHTLLTQHLVNSILQFPPVITWGRTYSFRGSVRMTMMWQSLNIGTFDRKKVWGEQRSGKGFLQFICIMFVCKREEIRKSRENFQKLKRSFHSVGFSEEFKSRRWSCREHPPDGWEFFHRTLMENQQLVFDLRSSAL